MGLYRKYETLSKISKAEQAKKRNNKRRKNQNRSRARIRKEHLVMMLGGICMNCKIEGPLSIYDFHHPDRNEKKFPISQMIRRASDVDFEYEVIPEVKKCVLLCANCHRILHNENDGEELFE